VKVVIIAYSHSRYPTHTRPVTQCYLLPMIVESSQQNSTVSIAVLPDLRSSREVAKTLLSVPRASHANPTLSHHRLQLVDCTLHALARTAES
jgi:hypothetical protein